MERDFQSFESIQDAIELITPEEQYESRLSERMEFEDVYYANVAKAHKFLETIDQQQPLAVTFNQNTAKDIQSPVTVESDLQIKLPTMHLPKFSGSYTEWPGFADSFRSAVHDNTNFRETQKLSYLRSCLTGKAAEKIESLETTTANYAVAWNLLENYYNDPIIVINNRIQAFFELPTYIRSNTASLGELVDQASKHYRALQALNKPFLEAFPIYAVTSKLDEATRMKWKERIQGKTDMPSMEELLQFLQARQKMLETNEKSAKPAFSDQPRPIVKTYNNTRPHQRSNVAYTAVQPSCALCKEKHYTASCSRLLHTEVNQRLGLIKQAGLCINCLRPNHAVRECRAANFLIIPHITNSLPTHTIARSELAIPKNIQLADPNFNVSSEIDGLIGADLFLQLLCVGQIQLANKAITLQKTKLGWVIAGRIPTSRTPKSTQCNLVTESVQDHLEKFWQLEESANENIRSKEETDSERHYQENTIRDLATGRYIVKFPFNDKIHQLGQSYFIALKRFRSLEQRLNKNPELRVKYTQFLDEYLKLGHMAETRTQTIEDGYYLPHHPILKQSSLTTKLRVVFDASAKTSKARTLREDFYVDDVITGANTYAEAAIIRDDLIQLCKQGGFDLRQWASNDVRLIEGLDSNTDTTHVLLDLEQTIKTLGIHWDARRDEITYSVNEFSQRDRVTKRTMLSQIASLFDPLGLIAPVIIRAKVLMQDLWKLQLNWDESVPANIFTTWCTFCNELKQLKNEQTTRKKRFKQGAPGIAVGALVIIREDNAPPLQWPLGRITAVHPGQDGVIRVVTVKTIHGEYKRCVKRVAPLPLYEQPNT
ncbi:uncharacterized protein LOC143210496 [Lasioglossum baleicum]|uniref:uncharacterized protein LOC143210496 n=1 Tax=Lasioglossum baleicum TaxID=434251 RepID=UPI003FCC8666